MKKAIFLFLALFVACSKGLLNPKDSTTRLVKDLNGLWHFRIDNSPTRQEGFTQQWYSKPLQSSGDTINMPVPASYNDITQDPTIKNFIGWAWYDRNFWIPASWMDGNSRVVLQFQGVSYNTVVWVNGKQVMTHEGGHLPFEAEITDYLSSTQPNTVTVAVNNTLNAHTLPPGTITYYDGPQFPPGYFTFDPQFDFFNYAGIHGSVVLYTTPRTYIDDITLVTTLEDDGSATVDFTISVCDAYTSTTYEVSLLDAKQSGAVADGVAKGTLKITNPNLWWPWTMSDNPGHMYPFQVKTDNEQVIDVYRQSYGLREVKVVGNEFLINGKPFYFHGVNSHEDWDTVGKGIYDALLTKDINLLKWLNVNALRTSHYPYSQDMLDLCDKEGIVVIDESPATGLQKVENFGNETLKHHLDVMKEMINRDKNHPSVVMWSLANEPASSLLEAETYFRTVVDTTRSLDPTRPITFACNEDFSSDRVSQYMDVIMLNYFYGWYINGGHTEVTPYALTYDLENWSTVHKGKPIIISEYGAGTLAGVHRDPPTMWSEEYEVQVMEAYWPIFDQYRKSFLVGELVLTFADYETAQSSTRPNGNRKGVFTRQRQPKLAAHFVKERYNSLANGKDYCPKTVYFK